MTQSNPSAVGIDIGGTRAKSVLIDTHGNILAEDERDSVEGESAFVSLVQAVLDELGAGSTLPIGLSCPGVAHRDHRAIASMPGRMAGLEGLVFTEKLGRQVLVLNDAHAATIGEVVLGAAAGLRTVVMLTLGTGVGGGIVIDGRLYTGATGLAGHVGHTTIDAFGKPDICKMPGSIEDAIGNHSVKLRSGERFESTRDLVDAANAGDAEAARIWQKSIECLGASVGSLVNLFDPEAVVIGGGIAAAGPALFDPLAAVMDRVEWRPFGKAVPILPATLGTQAGALGAALFALRPELRP